MARRIQDVYIFRAESSLMFYGGKEDSFLNFGHYFPWNLLILYRATLRRRLGQSDDVTRQSCNWVPSTHSIQGNIVHWNIHPIYWPLVREELCLHKYQQVLVTREGRES